MYNQVSALATYAGQLQFDAEDNPKWAMMDVNLGSPDEPLYVQAFIKQPEIIREMKQYLIDYNINRKIWFEGSIECDAGNMVIYIRKLLLLEKFYTRQELERIILIFKKLLSVVPKHYYVVDRMVFSDRSKITAMKMEMNKGCDTIKAMKENLFKAIGVVARTDYSNEQIIDLDPSEVWYLFDDDLEVALKKNEKG